MNRVQFWFTPGCPTSILLFLADRLPQVVRSISLSGEEMTVEEKSSAIAEELNRTFRSTTLTEIEST
jgi:hypothetical protein